MYPTKLHASGTSRRVELGHLGYAGVVAETLPDWMENRGTHWL